MKSRTALAIALAFVLASPAVLAQMPGMDKQNSMQMMMPHADDPASTKDLKQSQMNMMHNMNMKFTGDPDADFARSMIKHHEGAVDMAKIELKHGKDPEIRKMAEKMIKDQSDEIKMFQAWLDTKKTKINE